jgi:hypothetical protein
LSEKFQRTFISVREFIESWDKEIYELTNLDFFIFQTINHLGNQIEKRFFINERSNSLLKLSFDDIGTLCFNLGDSLEFFLQDNCFGNCNLNCPLDLDSAVNLRLLDSDENMQRRLAVFKSIALDKIVKEQCMRVHLMNHVILDTLIHFYTEEIEIEVNEEDIEIIEFADFIESVIVDFIRHEGQSLLLQSSESAMDYFEELIESEEELNSYENWSDKEETWLGNDSSEEWQSNFENIEDLFEKFIVDLDGNSLSKRKIIANDIDLFKEFLLEYADVKNAYELSEEHILEFLSYWLVQQYVLVDDSKIQHVFRNMAKFVTWLYNNYGIDYKSSFLSYYKSVKTDVPRVIRALNTYLNEYDLLEALTAQGKSDVEQICGFYEVKNLHSNRYKTFDLVDLHFFDQVKSVNFDSSAYLKLEEGDILQATLVKNHKNWKVLEVQYIFPKAAKPYLL